MTISGWFYYHLFKLFDITSLHLVRPDLLLRRINIHPDDITDIILTHPHHDHIGGINLFPNAKIWPDFEVVKEERIFYKYKVIPISSQLTDAFFFTLFFVNLE